MTTATKTRPKTDVRAALAEREQAWADAKAEADSLGSEFDQKFRQAEALGDEPRRLIQHEPGLVDHHGNPVAEDNPAAAIDRQLTALGDLADLLARKEHARALAERAKQAATDYTCAHLDVLLAELQTEAEATVAEGGPLHGRAGRGVDRVPEHGAPRRRAARHGPPPLSPARPGDRHRLGPAEPLPRLRAPAAAHPDPMSDENTTPTDAEEAAFARALFGWPEPEAEVPAEAPTDAPSHAHRGAHSAPDFDGGPRDPAPGPDNPEHDHNQLRQTADVAYQGRDPNPDAERTADVADGARRAEKVVSTPGTHPAGDTHRTAGEARHAGSSFPPVGATR
jgi:hypothetical protein